MGAWMSCIRGERAGGQGAMAAATGTAGGFGSPSRTFCLPLARPWTHLRVTRVREQRVKPSQAQVLRAEVTGNAPVPGSLSQLRASPQLASAFHSLCESGRKEPPLLRLWAAVTVPTGGLQCCPWFSPPTHWALGFAPTLLLPVLPSPVLRFGHL